MTNTTQVEDMIIFQMPASSWFLVLPCQRWWRWSSVNTRASQSGLIRSFFHLKCRCGSPGEKSMCISIALLCWSAVTQNFHYGWGSYTLCTLMNTWYIYTPHMSSTFNGSSAWNNVRFLPGMYVDATTCLKYTWWRPIERKSLRRLAWTALCKTGIIWLHIV